MLSSTSHETRDDHLVISNLVQTFSCLRECAKSRDEVTSHARRTTRRSDDRPRLRGGGLTSALSVYNQDKEERHACKEESREEEDNKEARQEEDSEEEGSKEEEVARASRVFLCCPAGVLRRRVRVTATPTTSGEKGSFPLRGKAGSRFPSAIGVKA